MAMMLPVYSHSGPPTWNGSGSSGYDNMKRTHSQTETDTIREDDSISIIDSIITRGIKPLSHVLGSKCRSHVLV